MVASALAVVGGTASAGEVICGKDWISFEPLSPEGFSEELGLNSYLVLKSDIRRGSAVVRGPLSQFGYLMITPLEGDARKTGEYRVTQAAYLAIQACLMGNAH
ncbi:MAG: hypothetical protein OXE86_13720 [Alphaproteobacteria bacterium]|nr:hypothetical protein [Alphaproteobacteria bacterium]